MGRGREHSFSDVQNGRFLLSRRAHLGKQASSAADVEDAQPRQRSSRVVLGVRAQQIIPEEAGSVTPRSLHTLKSSYKHRTVCAVGDVRFGITTQSNASGAQRGTRVIFLPPDAAHQPSSNSTEVQDCEGEKIKRWQTSAPPAPRHQTAAGTIDLV